MVVGGEGMGEIWARGWRWEVVGAGAGLRLGISGPGIGLEVEFDA